MTPATSLASRIISKNDDLPLKTREPVHSGKVRSVYWLDQADSQRLAETRGYAVAQGTQLAVMVISDRISAFECIWQGEGGLAGIPGKGAALNTIALHWFELLKSKGIASHHVVESPHPLVWIVQRAEPVRIEAIVRQYITGSLWRAYASGANSVCGISLPAGLRANQRLPEPIITPSTKGIIKGIAGVPEADDVNIARADIVAHLREFGFDSSADVERYEHILVDGFRCISEALERIGQIFVDTKFEFGYATDANGVRQLILIDEAGTPDSSRIWDRAAYEKGQIVENSKEGFRQYLLDHVPERELLLDKNRMRERLAMAASMRLPVDVMSQVGLTYTTMAERITGRPMPGILDPRAEILSTLSELGLVL